MPKKDGSEWSLSEGFKGRPEHREGEPTLCVNICEELNIDSDLPPEEKDMLNLTPDNSYALYREALRRADCPPVIIGMPHAGELVPEELFSRAELPEAFGGQGGLDTGTKTMFAPRRGEFAAIRARVNRMAVDNNRYPTDFEGGPPSYKGIIWESDLVGRPIYPAGKEPSMAEKEKLITDYYTPYYQALHATAATLLDRRDENGKPVNEQILFIDGHSFPGDEEVPAYKLTADQPKPLIIVGTGKGKTEIPGADEAVVAALIEQLERLIPDELVKGEKYLSEKVALNKYWTGTKNIKYWGKKEKPVTPEPPIQGSQAIQIEVNRQFFMKNGKYDRERLELLHKALYAGIAAAGRVLQGLKLEVKPV